MLNPIELGAMATAGLGGITVLWGNIKGIFARIESLIIVKAELQGQMADNFLNYCWCHFKCSPIGVRAFSSGDYFIRPKNRMGRIAFETFGNFMTFWKGWRPLFASTNRNNNDNKKEIISFIRGTFNLKNLIIESTNFYDDSKHEKLNGCSRYYVRKVFGKNIDNNNSNNTITSDPSYVQDNGHYAGGLNPLFYKKEDIGSPIHKNPMNDLSYDSNVQNFIEEINRWKNSRKWFEEKGLNWRFGAGLFGPPGTGKSSLARAIGQSLDLPIHSYDLTTMDNRELSNYWQESLNESPCIVLLEDIDRIFDEKKQIKTNKNKSPLTLDCLLNCISGVQPSNGILVLITANDVSRLDPALGIPDETGKNTRPGRLDRAVFVGVLTKDGREKIAKRILSDCPDLISKTIDEGENETGAQFESRCSRLALENYWGGFKSYGNSIDFKNVKAVLIPGIDKSADEIRREDSYS